MARRAGYAGAASARPAAAASTRSAVRIEVRIATTDERARRHFARYWRLIHPGSALIRVAWLRAIRRRAERPRG